MPENNPQPPSPEVDPQEHKLDQDDILELSPPPALTQESKEEEDRLFNKRLRRARRKRKHERGEHNKDVLNRAVLYAILAIIAFVIIGAGIWGWHLVTPTSWQWLSSDQLLNLESHLQVAASSAVGGALVKFVGMNSSLEDD